jgi:hypothetical protein
VAMFGAFSFFSAALAISDRGRATRRKPLPSALENESCLGGLLGRLVHPRAGRRHQEPEDYSRGSHGLLRWPLRESNLVTELL